MGSENLVDFGFIFAGNEDGILPLDTLLDLIDIVRRHEQRQFDRSKA